MQHTGRFARSTAHSVRVPADGFPPVPACLLARRPTQHTGLLGLWALTERNADGFGMRKAIDPLEMWPATDRATQRRAAQHAGVGDAGALANAWGRGVQARVRAMISRVR